MGFNQPTYTSKDVNQCYNLNLPREKLITNPNRDTTTRAITSKMVGVGPGVVKMRESPSMVINGLKDQGVPANL